MENIRTRRATTSQPSLRMQALKQWPFIRYARVRVLRTYTYEYCAVLVDIPAHESLM